MMRSSTPARSTFQREEVDASHRAADFSQRPDTRGIAMASETAARLVEEFGTNVVDWTVFRDEVTVVAELDALLVIATFLRDVVGFALLSDISPCDWLDSAPLAAARGKRFAVNYHVTKLVPGAPRLRLQVWVDEGEAVPTLINVWPTADWHEREAWDFFGIEFSGREEMRRLIMDEDWVGHPLRKDYPLGGEPVKFTHSLREGWDKEMPDELGDVGKDSAALTPNLEGRTGTGELGPLKGGNH